jgi:hypothetical protein
VGKRSPDRLSAIDADLAESAPSAVIESYGDEAVENGLEFAAYIEATKVYIQIRQEGKIPADWWKERLHSMHNRYVYEALSDIWEDREMTPTPPKSTTDDDHDCEECMAVDSADERPLTDQEVMEEKAAEDMYADRFDGPEDHPDEWSGPAIPMSAIESS